MKKRGNDRDMRYSQIPNAIKGLWGIRVQAEKDETEHVEWTVQRETGAEELNVFWAQLMGRGALPRPNLGLNSTHEYRVCVAKPAASSQLSCCPPLEVIFLF